MTPSFNNIHLSFWLTSFLFIPGFSQTRNNLYVDVGYLARTTFNYYESSSGSVSGPLLIYDAPWAHEKGVNGTGLNIAIGYFVINKAGISILASTTIRYDFYKFDLPKNRHTFYFDQSLALTKSIFKKGYGGTGITIFNINKELRYNVWTAEKILYLQFKSIDVLFGYPVWKLHIESKLSIVSENFPGKIKEDANLVSLKVFYRFKLNKQLGS